MRDHIMVDNVVANGQRNHWLGRTTQLIAEDGEGSEIVTSSFEQCLHSLSKNPLSVEVEELEGSGDQRAKISTIEEPMLEQLSHPRGDSEEALSSGSVTSSGFRIQDGTTMLRIIDGLTFAPTTRMCRDDDTGIEHSHLLVAGHERERRPSVLGRDRVSIAVEANRGGLIDRDRGDLLGAGQRIRENEQAVSLLIEHLCDATLLIDGVEPLEGDLDEKVAELDVSVFDGVDETSCEESLLEVTNGSLDTALVMRFSNAAESWLNVERCCEREQVRLEMDQVSLTLEDHGLGIIEEPLPGDSAEEERGVEQRSSQRMDIEVEDELCEDGSGEGQRHHEDPEGTRASGDED
jgi:hypothetical protein